MLIEYHCRPTCLILKTTNSLAPSYEILSSKYVCMWQICNMNINDPTPFIIINIFPTVD